MLVRFEDVGYVYADRAPVLQHVNLAVESGEIIAIVGRSGAGKTTLLKTRQPTAAAHFRLGHVEGATPAAGTAFACAGGSATSSRMSASFRI